MKNKKRIIISALQIVFVVMCFRYYAINTAFPNPVIKSCSIGQIANVNGYSVQVLSKKMYTKSELNPTLQDMIPTNFPELQDDFRICVVEVKFQNLNEVEAPLEVFRFMLQSGAWANGIDHEIFDIFNPEGKLNMVCKPNEEKTLLLTYSVIKKNFHEQDWVNIDQRNFDLVLSVYPEKGLIHLY